VYDGNPSDYTVGDGVSENGQAFVAVISTITVDPDTSLSLGLGE
jgi:hypothetical protein